MSERRMHTPYWDSRNSGIEIPQHNTNLLFHDKLVNKFNWYQGAFKVFKFLELNRDQTFTKHTMDGQVPLIQPDRGNCEREASGLVQIKEGGKITPCKWEMFLQFCNKEFYGTCFSGLLKWTKSGVIDDKETNKIINMAILEVQTSFMKSLLGMGVFGQLWDNPRGIADIKNNTTKVIEWFIKEHSVCEGIFKRILTKYPKRFQKDCLPDKLTKGCKADINVCEVFDKLLCTSDDQLQELVYEGGHGDANGVSNTPLFLTSSNLLPAAFSKLKDEAGSIFSNKDLLKKIERRPVTYAGITKHIYYICNVPMIPMSVFCGYNKYIDGEFCFAALTTSENMQIGNNFGQFYSDSGKHAVMTIEKETSNKDGKKGMVTISSAGLMAADVANDRLFNGTWNLYNQN